MCLVSSCACGDGRGGAALQQDVLIKAIGKSGSAKSDKQLKILDATAGFAHDALRMAAAGHVVTALERDPVLAPASTPLPAYAFLSCNLPPHLLESPLLLFLKIRMRVVACFSRCATLWRGGVVALCEGQMLACLCFLTAGTCVLPWALTARA